MSRERLRKLLARFESDAKTIHGENQLFPIDVLEGLHASDVDTCELGELQVIAAREFALLGCDEDRVLIAGISHRAWIPLKYAEQGFLWYGHSHPDASQEDRTALTDFQRLVGQEQSVIVTESGLCSSFTTVEDLSQWLPR